MGPVADFCLELRRLVRKCGVPQTEIAEAVGLKGNSVSELLGGKRRTPPDWEAVRRIVALCAERNGPGAPPPVGMSLDVRWWKGRHAELERTVETTLAPARRSPATPPAAPAASASPSARLGVADCVYMGLDEAVHLLADGRPELSQHADLLLGALFGEPNSSHVLDELLEGFPQRVRAAHGLDRSALLQAARVVLVAAAVVRWGPRPVEVPKMIQNLATGAYPAYAYGWAGRSGHPASMSPLADAMDKLTVDMAASLDRSFVELATPLAGSCPEFALTAGLPCAALNDRADSRAGIGLSGLGALLAEFAGRDARRADGRSLLHAPIASLDSPGPGLPSLAEGYVAPRFRLAGRALEASQIASDKWWELRPTYDAFERFIAAYLLSLPALLNPLLVLGHPGAGKSLFTKLLTARLPASEFRPLRVELRHAPAEADLQTQLEHALKRTTGRSVSWPDWSEAEPGVIPVVLLDGFDELLQAGAQRLDSTRQWAYLRDIEAFQAREAQLGRPLIVIVTSRTVVADRAEVPRNSQVLRLEPFGMPEIDRWLSIWNTANRTHQEQHGLRPLTREVVLTHKELAAHPLLLLMLALYDAGDNALHRLTDQDISRTQLYDRLLTEFVRRQVDKDGSLPVAEEDAAIGRELHRLSVIALGMFHRGAQAISGEAADRDLRALADVASPKKPGATGLLFGRFFFVHEAQAVVTEQRLRSYEFMHATFGEHLAARLIEGGLRRLAESAGGTAVDDGELYALLSFTPLTDRAQLVENLRDMLAAWPAGRARDELLPLLVVLFRAAEWEPGHRTDLGHAPVRVTGTHRNAVYEVNLMLLGVVAAGEVYASQFLGTERLIDNWRRHAMMWRSQLSDESWELLTSRLRPHRCWEPDPYGGGRRPDLRISTVSTPSVDHDHDIGWLFDRPESPDIPPRIGVELDSTPHTTAANVFTQVTFLGDLHSELLLHTAYPLLRRMPSTLLTYRTDQWGRHRSAAQSLIALLARQVHDPDQLSECYVMCLDSAESLEPVDVNSYLEAVSRQLAYDVARLPDDALVFVMRRLSACVESLGRLASTVQQSLLDCVYTAVGREVPGLTAVLAGLHKSLIRQGPADELDAELPALLGLAQAGRSSSTWQWSGLPNGHRVAAYIDENLSDFVLAELADRHPAAVIALLRTAAELGLDEWLATHAEKLLRALRPAAFGLLRPSDLGFLRAALPPGKYDTRFAEVEKAWRRG